MGVWYNASADVETAGDVGTVIANSIDIYYDQLYEYGTPEMKYGFAFTEATSV